MKIMSIFKVKTFLAFLLISTGILVSFKNETVETFAMPLSQKVVLIDAGHGGFDPGKVTDSQKFEKDINLEISLKLQKYLEQGGAYVITTRTIDEALGSSKSSDMESRKYIANTQNADIMVSIHQNSFPDKSVKGAQVFYYNKSDNSKVLAESIQTQIHTFVDYSNKNKAQPNSNYYLLKKTTIPAVIIECGFMTNPSELSKLLDDHYQSKLAWAVYMGIIDYFDALELV
jgi:N-acetylmuramoyl-L-alanine amidase